MFEEIKKGAFAESGPRALGRVSVYSPKKGSAWLAISPDVAERAGIKDGCRVRMCRGVGDDTGRLLISATTDISGFKVSRFPRGHQLHLTLPRRAFSDGDSSGDVPYEIADGALVLDLRGGLQNAAA